MHPLPFKEPPFTCLVNVRKLSTKGQTVTYEASESVCRAIAREFDLIEVDLFEGRCLVSPWRRNGVRVSGQIKACFSQPCAVSSKPLPCDICEEFTVCFVPEGSKLAQPVLNGEGEWILQSDGDDPPETFSGDSIDAGAVFLEFFALSLDPFARLKDESFEPILQDDGENTGQKSPFAVLKNLNKH